MTPLPSSIGAYLADVLRHLDHGKVTLTVVEGRVVAVTTQHDVRWQVAARASGVYLRPDAVHGSSM